jgi:putative autotransporter adhesin-like protein
MRSLFAIAILSTALAAPAMAETKSYNFNSFTKIDISAGYEVIFTQGAQRSVTIESNDFSKIIAEQNGDTLKISRPRNTHFNDRKFHDVVRITAPTLTEAELNAGVEFRADGLTVEDLELDINAGVDATFTRLKARNLTLDLNAGVDVKLSGECASIKVDAQAGVSLHAKDLKCRDAEVDAGVGSSVDIYATDKVVADASLGASVKVSGNPKEVQKQSSMSGTVTISR